MASPYVVVHKVLHVVEDVLALEYLESLSATPVSGRYRVVAIASDFFLSGTWHEDTVVQPPFAMMEGCICGRLVWSPWSVSANGDVGYLVLWSPVFHGIHGEQRVDDACWARG